MRRIKIAALLFALVITLGITKGASADTTNQPALSNTIWGVITNLANQNNLYNPYLNNYSYNPNNYSNQIAMENYYSTQRENIERERLMQARQKLIAEQIKAKRYEYKSNRYRNEHKICYKHF